MPLNVLPYLQSVRNALATSSEPSVYPGLLLDRLIVERTSGAALRTGFLADVVARLPDMERHLVGAASNAVLAVRELARRGGDCDVGDFEPLLERVGEIQRALMAQDAADADKLAKALMQLEREYFRAQEAAVTEQAAKSSGAATSSAARNVRQVDHTLMGDFLRRNFPDEATVNVAHSEFISGGFSKFTARIVLDHVRSLPRELILRGDGPATYGGSSVRDEYHLIKAVHEHGVRAPRPLALEESGTVFGSPFMLMERMPGKPMAHMFQLPATPNHEKARDIATTLASIHRVPLAALGEAVDGAAAPSSAKVLAWIEEGYRNWLPLGMPSPVFDAAFAWLRRHADINDRGLRTLVHGDYSLHNLLFEGPRVSSVLDWEFAHIGCPAYDFGYFFFMAEALAPWEMFLDAYASSGMAVPDEEQIDYNILLASTRLGVMVCQSTALFRSGTETGPALAPTVASGYYEMTIERIARLLDKVM